MQYTNTTSLDQTYSASISQPLSIKLPRDTAPRLLVGALAGLVATFPMTAVMRFLYQRLPFWQRYPLPPRRMIERLASRLGVRRAEQAHPAALTNVAHYGYGAACGALYALLSPRMPFLRLLNGVVFGLVVWLASYLGLAPAVGAMPPATRQPRARKLLMIAAHFVWGIALAMIYGIIEQRDSTEV